MTSVFGVKIPEFKSCLGSLLVGPRKLSHSRPKPNFLTWHMGIIVEPSSGVLRTLVITHVKYLAKG